MKFTFKFAFVVATLAIASHMASAQEISAKAADEQPVRKFGGDVAIGSPYPGLVGVNLSYNLNQDWRAIAGYSEIEMSSGWGAYTEKIKGETLALGVQRGFTNWAVRPVVGLHAAYFKVTKTNTDAELDIDGFDHSTGLAYSNIGIDWVAHSGFNLGTGMNVALAGGSGAAFYANVGKFF